MFGKGISGISLGVIVGSWRFDSRRLEGILLVLGKGISGISLGVIVGSWSFDCWFLKGSPLESSTSIFRTSSGSLGFGRWSFEGLLLDLGEGTSVTVFGS